VARKSTYNHENYNFKFDFYLPENSLFLIRRQVLEFSRKLFLFDPETKRKILIKTNSIGGRQSYHTLQQVVFVTA
jgi:hypothetical protein